jgi:hypothetical protein
MPPVILIGLTCIGPFCVDQAMGIRSCQLRRQSKSLCLQRIQIPRGRY